MALVTGPFYWKDMSNFSVKRDLMVNEFRPCDAVNCQLLIFGGTKTKSKQPLCKIVHKIKLRLSENQNLDD